MGQHKRLALLAACLEDRPFPGLDEWSADQDPAFKEVFYRELLPELKFRGKAVLVISHDDRYFHLDDRQQYAMSIRDAHCRGTMHRTTVAVPCLLTAPGKHQL